MGVRGALVLNICTSPGGQKDGGCGSLPTATGDGDLPGGRCSLGVLLSAARSAAVMALDGDGEGQGGKG